VGAIAEGLVGGMTAAAEPYGCPAGQAERLSFGIKDLELAFDADRTVVIDRYFRGRHFFS
jgi:hypothetical protein